MDRTVVAIPQNDAFDTAMYTLVGRAIRLAAYDMTTLTPMDRNWITAKKFLKHIGFGSARIWAASDAEKYARENSIRVKD